MSSSRSRCSWVVSSFRRQHCLFCFAQHLYSPSSLITNCRCLNLVSQSFLLNTSSRFARWLLVSIVSIVLDLCYSTLRVTLVSVLSSQSFLLCFSQHFDNTSTRSARCWVVPGNFLNTLTFSLPVLVMFSPLCRPKLLLRMFHSLELWRISTYFWSLSIRFLPCCFLFVSFIWKCLEKNISNI